MLTVADKIGQLRHLGERLLAFEKHVRILHSMAQGFSSFVYVFILGNGVGQVADKWQWGEEETDDNDRHFTLSYGMYRVCRTVCHLCYLHPVSINLPVQAQPCEILFSNVSWHSHYWNKTEYGLCCIWRLWFPHLRLVYYLMLRLLVVYYPRNTVIIHIALYLVEVIVFFSRLDFASTFLVSHCLASFFHALSLSL